MDSNEIVKELKAIKFALYICAALLSVAAVLPLLDTQQTLQEIQKSEESKSSTLLENKVQPVSRWSVETVRITFDKGHLDTVVKMSSERIKEFPYDAEPYWYRAKSYGLMKRYEEALKDLDNAEKLAPGWKDNYIEPLRKDLIKKMNS